MSRIGKKPIAIPGSVKIAVADGTVSVEGKVKLSIAIPPKVAVAVEEDNVVVSRIDDSRESGAMQGLARSLINNMVIGVTEGFKKELLIVGVGYRAQVKGKSLVLNLGYSHPVEYAIPEGLSISVTDNTKILVEGADKQMVGEAAATIRRYRKPEPYKGKGIRYADERITMKEGKSVG
ncbi:50S ribosomal protein L6 [Lentisphaerota bacterium ZTH]|nr:50S ribosomal protein L6 [Lentisphaerota bacterium]WET06023.1 50S ribosomal protein L6 [Lentisphaerota bacterium ZTH]